MNGADIQIAICGSAGDGTIATGEILRLAMARAGYRVIAFDLYPPEIRGFGECVARTRISTGPVYAIREQSDVLVSLNDGHAIKRVGEVRDYGAVIYDDAPISALAEGAHISAHIRPAHVPYGLSMREISERTTAGPKSRNMVALGYLAGLYDLPREAFREIVEEKFSGKAAVIGEGNLRAFDAGYEEGAATYRLDFLKLTPPAKERAGLRPAMLNGNAAIVRGSLDAGIDCFFGYPITPATSILEGLAVEMPKRGGRVLQTEDEISAISATMGAGYAGARAATATSGPGLALMAEMIGLGVMAEVPSVLFVSQRGGPSTGMPTKTEQSDLNLAVYGSAGDAQRIVLAPTNVEGCYRCAGRAFEMAETYQTPVIVLIDLYLSNRFETVDLPARAQFAADCNKHFKAGASAAYLRYAPSEDHISPRALPGEEGGVHTVTGLEHNEAGRPRDDPDVHTRMTVKRHEKLKTAVDFPDLTITKRFGDEGPVDVGIVTWGSTFGECLEAMELAREEGIRCSAMKVVMLSPLPVEPIKTYLEDCAEVLVPELNYEGQFAHLLTGAVGRPVERVNAVPGMPMHSGRILAAIRRLAGRESEPVAA